MSEGMEAQTPNPETKPSNPTEASKGFLKKVGRNLRDVGIAMTPSGMMALGIIKEGEAIREAKEKSAATDNGSQNVEQSTSPKPTSKFSEEPQELKGELTPTDASKRYLEETRKLIKDWKVILPAATAIALGSGLVGEPGLTDIAQGNYRNAAIKGVIAGLSFAPLGYKILRGR